jgi:chorismate-pyruvate lyase
MAGLDHDPDFRTRAQAALGEIVRKMPSGVAEEADIEAEFDALCAEAQALVLGRLAGRTC